MVNVSGMDVVTEDVDCPTFPRGEWVAFQVFADGVATTEWIPSRKRVLWDCSEQQSYLRRLKILRTVSTIKAV